MKKGRHILDYNLAMHRLFNLSKSKKITWEAIKLFLLYLLLSITY